MLRLLFVVMFLTGCGGGDFGSSDKYFFEYKKSSYNTAIYGPYPSLAACAEARSKYPSYYTTGCYK